MNKKQVPDTFVSEPGELYEVVDQLKALGFILRHTPDELPMQGQHAYGLGCILDRIASEVETQITGGRRA